MNEPSQLEGLVCEANRRFVGLGRERPEEITASWGVPPAGTQGRRTVGQSEGIGESSNTPGNTWHALRGTPHEDEPGAGRDEG